jgi:replicative DNA helicase
VSDLVLEKGLPANLDAERFVLGSVLKQDADVGKIELEPADFSLETHRRIWRRMLEMHKNGDAIDRLTLSNELMRYNELSNIGGMSFLTTLDDGLPRIVNLPQWAKIVKEKSVLRQTIFRSQHLMNECLVAETPASEILSNAAHDFIALNSFTQSLASATPGGVVEAYKGGIDAFLAPPPGLSTGFAQLDQALYGLQPATTYVIGADTSVGKSSYALQLAMQVASSWTPVLYCSLEMSKEALVRRLVSSRAGVALHKIMGGKANLVEMQTMKTAHEELANLPLYLDDDPYCSAISFGKKIEQHIRQHKIKLAVLDQLQLLDWQGKGTTRFRDEREAISFATRQCVQYVKQFGIPIIEVSHLSRNRALRSTKDLRPKLRDLHGSSSIEKDANSVMFIYRPEMDEPGRREVRGRAELLVAKNRDGALGTIHMRFEGEFTRFRETEAPEDDGTPAE